LFREGNFEITTFEYSKSIALNLQIIFGTNFEKKPTLFSLSEDIIVFTDEDWDM
jgi:hypothetical protein